MASVSSLLLGRLDTLREKNTSRANFPERPVMRFLPTPCGAGNGEGARNIWIRRAGAPDRRRVVHPISSFRGGEAAELAWLQMTHRDAILTSQTVCVQGRDPGESGDIVWWRFDNPPTS